MKSIFLIISMFVFTSAFCQNHPEDLKQPKGFVMNLIRICKEVNTKEWETILSKRIKERQKDHVAEHLAIWSEYFSGLSKKYNGKYDQLKVSYDQKRNKINIKGEFSIIVTKENGQFRIDEN